MDINKKFVIYEQALALKELDFDETCFKQANPNGHIMWRFLCADEEQDYCLSVESIIKSPMYEPMIGVPTYSQAFRWFRDNHNFHHYIEPIHRNGKVKYEWCVVASSEDDKEFEEDEVNSYEEAEIACLDKLIEIVKNEKRN